MSPANAVSQATVTGQPGSSAVTPGSTAVYAAVYAAVYLPAVAVTSSPAVTAATVSMSGVSGG